VTVTYYSSTRPLPPCFNTFPSASAFAFGLFAEFVDPSVGPRPARFFSMKSLTNCGVLVRESAFTLVLVSPSEGSKDFTTLLSRALSAPASPSCCPT
jgi:hypothetical protein